MTLLIKALDGEGRADFERRYSTPLCRFGYNSVARIIIILFFIEKRAIFTGKINTISTIFIGLG